MSNLKQRLERIEKMSSPKDTPVAEWAIRHVQVEQEFQRMLNEMKQKYRGGDPIPLLTQDQILEKAQELTAKYGSEDVLSAVFAERGKSSKCQELLSEMNKKHGLV